MRFTHILFDLDGTLIDYDREEVFALESTLNHFGYQFDDGVLAHYKRVNNHYWRCYEQGSVTREELRHNRLIDFFGAISKPVPDIDAFSTFYLDCYGLKPFAMEGAEALVEEIAKLPVSISVVTNGILELQRRRLDQTKLGVHFPTIFASDNVGFQKPQQQFFDHVKVALHPIDFSKTLLVGDSLIADIKGGNDAGMATCWFNEGYATCNDTGIQPTFEITTLEGLRKILATADFYSK